MDNKQRTDEQVLEESKDTELAKRLLERLSAADAGFVLRLLGEEGYCGGCFGKGPYCCYDSVLD